MQVEQPSIKTFLGQRKALFVIPEFQRPYSWEPDNAMDMIEDLNTCIEENKNHYFGTIFYEAMNEGNSLTIIDGQQRITTVLLMIMAIYHLIGDNPELGKGGDDNSLHYSREAISEEFLYDSAFSKVKLRTVAYDNRIFQEIYDTGGKGLTKEEKQSNLWRVYKAFRNYFSDKVALNDYINALDKFRVIKLGLQSEDDNPQRVFESINSTGRALSDGDKIRNFALMLNGVDMSKHVYERYWSEIERTLTRPDCDNITDFFRSYLIAKRQSIIKTDIIYAEFKKYFREQITDKTNIEQVDAFFSDILEYLKYYKVLALDDCEESLYKKTIIPTVAQHMRYIHVGIYIPFAMSVMAYHASQKISTAELEEVFRLIELIFARRNICNLSTLSIDKVLADIHRNTVNDLSLEPNSKYIDILKFRLLSRTGQTRIPTDTEIRNAIATIDSYNRVYSNIMYILCSANDVNRPKESNLLDEVIRGDMKRLSVEHIMPQTINKKDRNGKAWIEMLGPDWAAVHEQYLHTLGNLTITGYNSEYSNLPYVDRNNPEHSKMHLVDRHGNHVGLADSDLAINKYIATHFETKWDKSTIEKRQKWWFKTIDKLWPYPTTSYKPEVADKSMPIIKDKDYSGSIISSINILGEFHTVSQWSDALDIIAETLYEHNPKIFASALDDEFLSNYVSKPLFPPRGALQVLDTSYYVSINNNTNTKIRIILALMKLYGLDQNDIKVDTNIRKVNNETA